MPAVVFAVLAGCGGEAARRVAATAPSTSPSGDDGNVASGAEDPRAGETCQSAESDLAEALLRFLLEEGVEREEADRFVANWRGRLRPAQLCGRCLGHPLELLRLQRWMRRLDASPDGRGSRQARNLRHALGLQYQAVAEQWRACGTDRDARWVMPPVGGNPLIGLPYVNLPRLARLVAGAEVGCAVTADEHLMCWGSLPMHHHDGGAGGATGRWVRLPGVVKVPLPNEVGLIAPLVTWRALGGLDRGGYLWLAEVVVPDPSEKGETVLRWAPAREDPMALGQYRRATSTTDGGCLAMIDADREVVLAQPHRRWGCGGMPIPERAHPPVVIYGVRVLDPPPLAREVVAGAAHVCVLDGARRVWCVGDDSVGQIGGCLGSDDRGNAMKLPPLPEQGSVVLLAAHGNRSCVVGSGSPRRITCWGEQPLPRGRSSSALCPEAPEPSSSPRSTWGPDDLEAPLHSWQLEAPEPVEGIALGARFGCALLRGGSVRCWGDNEHGQLGVAARRFHQELASRIPLPAPAEEIVAGAAFACAGLRDGSVWCWGDGRRGQLGPAVDTGRHPSPVRVPLDSLIRPAPRPMWAR